MTIVVLPQNDMTAVILRPTCGEPVEPRPKDLGVEGPRFFTSFRMTRETTLPQNDRSLDY